MILSRPPIAQIHPEAVFSNIGSQLA